MTESNERSRQTPTTLSASTPCSRRKRAMRFAGIQLAIGNPIPADNQGGSIWRASNLVFINLVRAASQTVVAGEYRARESRHLFRFL